MAWLPLAAHAAAAEHHAGWQGAVWFGGILCAMLAALTAIAARGWAADRRALRRCPMCAASAVRTRESAGVEHIHAWLWLECGQCGTWRRILTTPRRARRQARTLQRDRAAICSGIDQIAVARERDDIDAFACALHSKIVGADDFLALTRRPEQTGRG